MTIAKEADDTGSCPCTAIGQCHSFAQRFGRGINGRGMGRKTFGFIPLPAVPQPIISLPSFGLNLFALAVVSALRSFAANVPFRP
jgi:hypothetical protein